MNDLSYVWGDAIDYKGVLIYPVKMRDSIKFYESVSCLTIEKNKSPDIEIIKMSYIRFLILLSIDAPNEYGGLINSLVDVLKISCRTNNIELLIDDSINVSINGILLNEEDIDEVKNIVLNQNLIQVSDTIFDSEIEKALQEAKEFMVSKTKGATLLEQIVAFHCISGRSFDEIKEYTIYQFSKCTERYVILKNFEVYSALMAENGKSEEIEHWLSSIPEKGMYDDVSFDKEKMDKITAEF